MTFTPPKGVDGGLRSRGVLAGRVGYPSPLTSGSLGHTSAPTLAGGRPKRLPAQETTCEEAWVQTPMNRHITHGSAAGVTFGGFGGGRAVWQDGLAGGESEHAGRAVLATACNRGHGGGRPYTHVHPDGPRNDGTRHRGGRPSGAHPSRPLDNGHVRGGRPTGVHPLRPFSDGPARRGGRPAACVHPVGPTLHGHERGGRPSGVHPFRPAADRRGGGLSSRFTHPLRSAA
jgi:hypothetical protein